MVKPMLRLEGLTLAVANVRRSLAYYKKLGFKCTVDAAPNFAMVEIGGGSIGLLSQTQATKGGAEKASALQRRNIHVELSTDDLDELYKRLVAKGIKFHMPPHDEPWERSASAFDPDGYTVEIAQGDRGRK